jgi:hypothetical protein
MIVGLSFLSLRAGVVIRKVRHHTAALLPEVGQGAPKPIGLAVPGLLTLSRTPGGGLSPSPRALVPQRDYIAWSYHGE